MIEIGSTIYLELKEWKDGEETTIQYRSRLMDINESIFIIDYPLNVETHKLGFFIEGTEFTAKFHGKDGALYVFQTEILGRKRHNIPMLILKDPGKKEYVRIQRRSYVRVETSVNVALHSLQKQTQPIVSVTLDLSGGGCAIVLPFGKEVKDDEQFHIWIVIPMKSGEIEYVRTLCTVVRQSKPNNDANMRVSLQFTDMNDRDRQKIMRYCFERQAVLLKMKKEEKG